jgi:hypothetical protein
MSITAFDYDFNMLAGSGSRFTTCHVGTPQMDTLCEFGEGSLGLDSSSNAVDMCWNISDTSSLGSSSDNSSSCSCSSEVDRLSAQMKRLEETLFLYQLENISCSSGRSSETGENSEHSSCYRKKKKKFRQCYRCGKRNHIAKNCKETVGSRSLKKEMKNDVNVLLLDTILVEDMRKFYAKLGHSKHKLFGLMKECELDTVENVEVLDVVCREAGAGVTSPIESPVNVYCYSDNSDKWSVRSYKPKRQMSSTRSHSDSCSNWRAVKNDRIPDSSSSSEDDSIASPARYFKSSWKKRLEDIEYREFQKVFEKKRKFELKQKAEPQFVYCVEKAEPQLVSCVDIVL